MLTFPSEEEKILPHVCNDHEYCEVPECIVRKAYKLACNELGGINPGDIPLPEPPTVKEVAMATKRTNNGLKLNDGAVAIMLNSLKLPAMK